MPAGRGAHVLDLLRRELGVIDTAVHHARGVGTGSARRRSLYREEKQIVVALVEADRADAVFEMLFREARLDERHAGMVFVERVRRASPMPLPEGDWEPA